MKTTETKQLLENIGQNQWGDSNFSSLPLDQDASARKYYRVQKAKESLIVCIDESLTKEKMDDFLQLQKILEKNSVRVPCIHAYDADKKYLLEEDAGDTTLLKHLVSPGNNKKEYEIYTLAIDELINIHTINPEIHKAQAFTQRAFDREKLMFEVEFTCEHFFYRFLKRDKSTITDVKNLFEELCESLAQEKRVVTHRDFHSKNIMVCNNEYIIIDFQDTMMGPPQYDLASLLEDCYYSINPCNKERLKQYYWDKFSPSMKFEQDKKTFDSLYDLVLVQRMFKTIGTFAYLFNEKNTVHYLPYIAKTFENIRITLVKHERFEKLSILLNNLYYGQ